MVRTPGDPSRQGSAIVSHSDPISLFACLPLSPGPQGRIKFVCVCGEGGGGGASTKGGSDLRPQRQGCTTNKSSKKLFPEVSDDLDDTGSSLTESVHVETAPNSDSDSSDTEERGN